MISGVNTQGSFPLQPGNAARERTDAARNPTSSPQKAYEEVRDDLSGQRALVVSDPRPSDGEVSSARRVEARKAAEDVRLERFHADDLPLMTTKALAMFVGVAGFREGDDVELVGVDIHI